MVSGNGRQGNKGIAIRYRRNALSVEEMHALLGDAPMILNVFPDSAGPIAKILRIMPQSRIIAFARDDTLREFFDEARTVRAVCIKTLLGSQVCPPRNGDNISTHQLDWFQDQYVFPIDMVICENKMWVPSVILGGVRTFPFVRYALLGSCGGLRDFLPDFERIGSYGNSILLKNKTIE